MQVSATRTVETAYGGITREKYVFDDIQMTELNQSNGITSGQVLQALSNNNGVMENPDCANITAEGMKAALGKDIEFSFDGYSVAFHDSQIQDEINLFAVKKSITPVSEHYNTDGVLSTIMFSDRGISFHQLPFRWRWMSFLIIEKVTLMFTAMKTDGWSFIPIRPSILLK